MEYVSIRFFIGLHSPYANSTPDAVAMRKQRALDILSLRYEGGTLLNDQGFWKGKVEPSITFETIQKSSEAVIGEARSTALELRKALAQDAIGLAITPTAFELI